MHFNVGLKKKKQKQKNTKGDLNFPDLPSHEGYCRTMMIFRFLAVGLFSFALFQYWLDRIKATFSNSELEMNPRNVKIIFWTINFVILLYVILVIVFANASWVITESSLNSTDKYGAQC